MSPSTHSSKWTQALSSLLPNPEASCLLLCVPCRAVPCRAVPRHVFGCDVMRGQEPVAAAIGDSFPATALSLLPRKEASKVGGYADMEEKVGC